MCRCTRTRRRGQARGPTCFGSMFGGNDIIIDSILFLEIISVSYCLCFRRPILFVQSAVTLQPHALITQRATQALKNGFHFDVRPFPVRTSLYGGSTTWGFDANEHHIRWGFEFELNAVFESRKLRGKHAEIVSEKLTPHAANRSCICIGMIPAS
jgi:hypothetical protein